MDNQNNREQNETTDAAEEVLNIPNQNLANFVKLNKDIKFKLILDAPQILAIFLIVLSLFLPVAKIMYYHPKNVTIFDLSDYELSYIPLFLCLIGIVIGMTAPESGVPLIKKNRLNTAIAFDIIAGVVTLICTILFSVACENIITELQSSTSIRIDKGAGYTLAFIAGIMGTVYSIAYGICLGFIKEGKIKIGIK